MNNQVAVLKRIKFLKLPLQEQLKIKELGRPTPDLNISQTGVSRDLEYTRKFSNETYDKYNWICGCGDQNAMYCFPCLLFGSKDVFWAQEGFSDLKNKHIKITKHQNTYEHKDNVIKLKLLGCEEKLIASPDHYELIMKHNLKVDKNREILLKLLNCILFNSDFELVLTKHEDTNDVDVSEKLLNSVNIAKNLNEQLKVHIENTIAFQNIKSIKYQILNCMLQVVRGEIINELSKTDFVSVIAINTNDVSSHVKLALIVRYVNKYGDAVERFWGFYNPTDINSVRLCIRTELTKLIPRESGKLISISYDDVFSKSFDIIKEEFINVQYIHGKDHPLNYVLQRVMSQYPSTRKFFTSVNSISTFFTNSTNRSKVLAHIFTQQNPTSSPIRWNNKNISHNVKIIDEHKEILQKCLKTISESPSCNDVTISKATALECLIMDSNFNYWLKIFSLLMPQIDIFYNNFQDCKINSSTVSVFLESFLLQISILKNSLSSELSSTPNIPVVFIKCEPSEDYLEENGPSAPKRSKIDNESDGHSTAFQVLQSVATHVQERFAFTGYLEAVSLFLPSKFIKYCESFPEEQFEITVQCYGQLNRTLLHSELRHLYCRNVFRNFKTQSMLLKFLINNDMDDLFPESMKLLKIVTTMPLVTAAETENNSKSESVKSFLANTLDLTRLTSLGMMAIEKSYVTRIPNFYDKVMKKFACFKDRRADFLHKSF